MILWGHQRCVPFKAGNPTHCQIKPFSSATAVFTRDNRRGHRSLGNILAAPFGNTVEIPEVEFRGEDKVETGEETYHLPATSCSAEAWQ